MKFRVAVCAYSLFMVSCSSHQFFEIPKEIPIPEGWNAYSFSTFKSSHCPRISGQYLDDPDRYSTPGSQFADSKESRFGYSAVMSFYRSEESDPNASIKYPEPGVFTISQINEDSFILRDLNLMNEPIDHHSDRAQGDFYCQDGKIFFPLITRFGANQSGSFNDQHQRVVASDNKGNLILIRITGAYKKTAFTRTARIEYDFIRYQKISE